MVLLGIKLVTFDATNTLLKFKVPPWQYYAVVAREYGFTGSDEEVKRKLKKSFRDMWTKHPNFGKNSIHWQNWWKQVVDTTLKGCLPESADAEQIANKLIEDYKTSNCWVVGEGGYNILHMLNNRGVTIGVISNFDPRLKEILRNLDLYKEFEFILTSYESGYTKPDIKIFNEALMICSSDVKPNEALHIGDDYDNDYEGAKAAGWHALLLGHRDTETPSAKEHVFSNLDEISLVIEQNKLKLN